MCANRPDASLNDHADLSPVSNQARIAILGGSSAFTPALASALGDRARDLPPLEIRLQGRNEDRLIHVSRFCNKHVRERSIPHEYSWSLSIEDAVRDADIVINQMRIGGWLGRAHDDTFPLEFDLPGDETIGPGGLASAVRSVKIVMDSAKECLRIAPNAWFVNMSNPMGILLGALNRISGLKTFGLCELPTLTLEVALKKAGLTPDQVEADYLGLNHQGWFLRINHNNKDILPSILDKIQTPEDLSFFKVDPEVMKEKGALPLPYMRVYYHTLREAEKMKAKKDSRGGQLMDLSGLLYDYYKTSQTGDLPDSLKSRGLIWFKMALVPAMIALLGGEEQLIYVSQVNKNHIPELNPDTIVEKRCFLSKGGVKMIPFMGPLPEKKLEFLRAVAIYEEKALQAALDPTLENIKTALSAHPLTPDPKDLGRMAQLTLQPVEQG